MTPEDYPEIKALDLFIESQAAEFIKDDSVSILNFVAGRLVLSGNSYAVFIDDEFKDLERADKRIGVVLALREFEIIEESTDYLNWCTMQGIPAHLGIIRSYYQDTVNTIYDIKKHFKTGRLTSFISDLDYQLDAGAMQRLRRSIG